MDTFYGLQSAVKAVRWWNRSEKLAKWSLKTAQFKSSLFYDSDETKGNIRACTL